MGHLCGHGHKWRDSQEAQSQACMRKALVSVGPAQPNQPCGLLARDVMPMHKATLVCRCTFARCQQAQSHAYYTQMDTETQAHICPFFPKNEGKYLCVPSDSPSATCHAFPASLPLSSSLFPFSLSYLPGLPHLGSPSSMAPLPTQLPPASQWAASFLASYVPFGPALPSGILAGMPRCRWHGSIIPPLQSSLPSFLLWLPPEPPAVPAPARREIGRE